MAAMSLNCLFAVVGIGRRVFRLFVVEENESLELEE